MFPGAQVFVLLLLVVGLVSSARIAVYASELSGDVPAIEATVTRAIDGTSLDAHVDGRRTALGYLGVEAAPLNQPCGREARDRNRELAGAHVRLVEDPGYFLDETGRRLYYAFTADGQSIDEILVREGLARAVRIDASRGAYLMVLQAEAESAGRGCLWDGSASAG